LIEAPDIVGAAPRRGAALRARARCVGALSDAGSRTPCAVLVDVASRAYARRGARHAVDFPVDGRVVCPISIRSTGSGEESG
jgi:hypothetical protein